MANSASTALPAVIASPSDVKSLRRELEVLNDFMHQASLRKGGKAVKMPQTSRLLDELADLTSANLLRQQDRDKLLKYLELLLKKAPVLHVSVASEPSVMFVEQLVLWLRANIHPQVLIRIGVQPAITAGCIVRTPNKQFDFSLRHTFDDRKGSLIDALKAAETPAEIVS